ncbi:MAG: DMT family transporter [Burkholderiales bacterium]|nr:DMT family transporter [Burkholderiales bacterium]
MSGAGPARESHPIRGILLLMGAVMAFATMEAIVKWLALRNPVAMIVWARYFFHTLLILVLMAPAMGWGLVRSRRPGLQWLRGAILGVSSLLFFAGLKVLPLAEAASLTAIAPAGTAWALALSFSGVLLIVRPGSAIFTWAALLPLGSALCYAGYQLLTRKLSTIDDGRVSQFIGALVATLLLSLLVPFHWQMPEQPLDIALMVATGAVGGFGHLLLVRAFAAAPVSLLAPFTYAHLVFALLLGLLVFGNMPDSTALAGMALIVSTGVMMGVRQRRPAEPGRG